MIPSLGRGSARPPAPLSELLRSALRVLDRLRAPGEVFAHPEVVVPAPAPFAASSYARARLLRQMYASGLSSRTDATGLRQGTSPGRQID